MTYRVNLPKGSDPAVVLPKLRQLEEEDPQLHLLMECGQIHVQIMGKVQLEIFRSLVQQRFNLDITLDDRRIFYKDYQQSYPYRDKHHTHAESAQHQRVNAD